MTLHTIFCLVSKLINKAKKDTIDERALNFPKGSKKLNPWETKENINLVINSAKAIGCRIVSGITAKHVSRPAQFCCDVVR